VNPGAKATARPALAKTQRREERRKDDSLAEPQRRRERQKTDNQERAENARNMIRECCSQRLTYTTPIEEFTLSCIA